MAHKNFHLKKQSIKSLCFLFQSVTKYLSVYHTPRAVLVLGTVMNKTDKDQTKKGIKAKEQGRGSGFSIHRELLRQSSQEMTSLRLSGTFKLKLKQRQSP